jgi:hypothetical protein
MLNIQADQGVSQSGSLMASTHRSFNSPPFVMIQFVLSIILVMNHGAIGDVAWDLDIYGWTDAATVSPVERWRGDHERRLQAYLTDVLDNGHHLDPVFMDLTDPDDHSAQDSDALTRKTCRMGPTTSALLDPDDLRYTPVYLCSHTSN